MRTRPLSGAAFDSDAYQAAFGRAFRAELYAILDALPTPPGGRVLDVPCGTGYYTRRLGERLGPDGRLVAVDASDDCVRAARAATAGLTGVEVRPADAYALPFAASTFDLVWCAQSLITLDPARAARELGRVVKPAGVVAILEVDEFHRVLLPWPVEVEAALPLALQAAAVQRYGDGGRTSPARRLRGVLAACGFRAVRRITYAFDRAAPFDRATAAFLARHFEYLRGVAYPHLTAGQRERFDRMTDPDEAGSLYHRPDVELVCLNALYLAGAPTPA